MDDIFGKQDAKYTLKDYKLERMVLAPAQWKRCKLPVPLRWRGVKFDRDKARHVPDNERGVYTFVVRPGIANHRNCAYLMYVGKAEKQVLRARFVQYFAEKTKGDDSRRVHIAELLRKWDGYLWFYYATVTPTEVIKKVEDLLLASYLPPSNRTFPSSVRTAVKKLFA